MSCTMMYISGRIKDRLGRMGWLITARKVEGKWNHCIFFICSFKNDLFMLSSGLNCSVQ